MANPSYFFECQEEKAMLELRSAFQWQLAPDRLEVLQGKVRKEYRDDRLVHRR
jgi:hypothetical protein